MFRWHLSSQGVCLGRGAEGCGRIRCRGVDGCAMPTPGQDHDSCRAFPTIVQQVLPVHEPEIWGPKLCREKAERLREGHGSPVEVMGVVAASQGCWLQAGASHLLWAAESPMRGLGKEHTSFQESLVRGGQRDLGQPTGSLRASQMLVVVVAQRPLIRGWRPPYNAQQPCQL